MFIFIGVPTILILLKKKKDPGFAPKTFFKKVRNLHVSTKERTLKETRQKEGKNVWG
jgi:hypothetical protein